jgi:hypothetical protein
VTPSSRRWAQAWYSSLIWPQMAETVDLEIAAWSPSALSEGGLHVADRQAPHERGNHQASSAFVLVTWEPNRPDANASLVPRSFGRDKVTGPAVVFTVTSRYPLQQLQAAGSSVRAVPVRRDSERSLAPPCLPA